MSSNWELAATWPAPDLLWAWPRPLKMEPGAVNAVLPVYRWWWRSRLPGRYGQLCVITARGRMNSVRVEFLADGAKVIASRFAVRRARSRDVPTDFDRGTLTAL